MTKDDIYTILKKNPGRWLTVKQIKKIGKLDVGIGSLTVNLKRLRDHNQIQFRRQAKYPYGYEYKCEVDDDE